MDYVALRCALQHWYELRPEGDPIGIENSKRLINIKQLHMVWRRQGEGALRGNILDAAKGRRITDAAYLPIAAGLFSDDLAIETFVRRTLGHSREEFRVAATYGAIFFLNRSTEIASILAERAMLDKGIQQQASADAMTVAQSLPCTRCRRRTSEPGWCPVRSS